MLRIEADVEKNDSIRGHRTYGQFIFISPRTRE